MAKSFEKLWKAGRWKPLFLYRLLTGMIYDGKAQKMWRYLETIE
jgi:hypothetical protein